MHDGYLAALRRFSSNARLYLAVWALIGFVYYGLFAVVFNLYLLRLGYGTEFIGLVNALYMFAHAGFALPAGWMGRRLGLRPTMLAGMASSTLLFGAVILTEVFPAPVRSIWLPLTYGLAGMAGTLVAVNGAPFIMASTTPEDRGHAFSILAAIAPLLGIAGNLAGGILPGFLARILGTALDDPSPYRYTLAAAPFIYAVGFLLLSRTSVVDSPPRSKRSAKAGREFFVLISLLAVANMLRQGGAWTVRVFFNVYMDAELLAPTALIGILAACGQLLSVPTALAMPLLTRRWGRFATLLFSILGVAPGLALMALVPGQLAAGIGYMLIIAVVAFGNAAYNVYSQEIVSPDLRPMVSGATSLAFGLGTSTVAFSGGFVIASHSYQVLFLLGIGLVFLGGLVFWSYFRRPRGEMLPRKIA